IFRAARRVWTDSRPGVEPARRRNRGCVRRHGRRGPVRARAIPLALAAACALPAAARANPIDTLGFGSRAIAMGNAGSAISDDGAANHYNPAGLVRGHDLRIDIGYRWARPILRINGRDLGVDDARGWQLGLAAPGHIGPFRFAFGVALWLPDQRLSRVRSL